MMASIGDPPIHCPKCGKVHGRGEYECDDSPLWPARCRGYLEGRQASDCLANVELARLRAENERLRAALVDAQGYGEMLERVLLPFSNFAVAFLNNVSDGHWPEASGSTTRWQGMTAGTEITFGDLANAAAALKDVPCP